MECNCNNLLVYYFIIAQLDSKSSLFNNCTAVHQDDVNDLLPHKKISQFDSKLGTEMFNLGQKNEKQNRAKERLSQLMGTNTRSYNVNQMSQNSNSFPLQQEVSKDKKTTGIKTFKNGVLY